MESTRDQHRPKIVTALIETFGFSPLWASIVALFLAFLGAAALVWLWLSAPPRVITITSGPPGSSFHRYAEAYQKALAEDGVTLRILPSDGSLDNLKRLQSPDSGADLGFVQGGHLGDALPPSELITLGSIAYQPLWVFYRGSTPIKRLSELAGKRIGIGAPGSGAHALASLLLQLNGITGPPSTLVEQASEGAAADLIAGKLDAAFLMGDSASLGTLRTLVREPQVQLYSFTQADAYVRRHSFLNKIVLPQGAFDVGQNLPAQEVVLVGPTVELVARKGLNSAISDLVIDKARTVHGRATILQKRDEFPAPLGRDFTLSEDAQRFYKSGRGLLYKAFGSFWLASLINRALVVIVPIILLLIPALRFLPIAYKWSVQLRIYRCYRPLLRLEREAQAPLSRDEVQDLLGRLDEIEQEVNALKVPASFAYQFYALRGHLAFVRGRLKSAVAA